MLKSAKIRLSAVRARFSSACRNSPYALYDRYRTARLKMKARRLVARYLDINPVRKLQIGCGGEALGGWLNSDLTPYTREIAYLDAARPFPIPDSSFDYVYSEHVFEHLSLVQQHNFVRESFRILKPGGRIRIATPDFEFLMRLAAGTRSELESRYLAWNFSHFMPWAKDCAVDRNNLQVYVVNNYFRDWGHQFVHSAATLQHTLRTHGFSDLRQFAVGKSDDPVLAGIEHHGGQIGAEYNDLETVIVEGRKP